MSKFYSLIDFVHDMGLNMGEFHRLDAETQEKWRQAHQRKLKKLLQERDASIREYYWEYCFCPEHTIDPDTFENLDPATKQDWLNKFNKWFKTIQNKKD